MSRTAVIIIAISFIFSLPVSYWLAYSKFKGKVLFETLLYMPMVSPPTALGHYFSLFISPTRGLGKYLSKTSEVQLTFIFERVIMISIVADLPSMTRPLQNGFAALPKQLEEAAYTLGKSKWTTFWCILLPDIKPFIITGLALTLAHYIDESGIILMASGSTSNETKVASVESYGQIQALNCELADQYVLILFAISFILLLAIPSINKRQDTSYL